MSSAHTTAFTFLHVPGAPDYWIRGSMLFDGELDTRWWDGVNVMALRMDDDGQLVSMVFEPNGQRATARPDEPLIAPPEGGFDRYSIVIEWEEGEPTLLARITGPDAPTKEIICSGLVVYSEPDEPDEPLLYLSSYDEAGRCICETPDCDSVAPWVEERAPK